MPARWQDAEAAWRWVLERRRMGGMFLVARWLHESASISCTVILYLLMPPQAVL